MTSNQKKLWLICQKEPPKASKLYDGALSQNMANLQIPINHPKVTLSKTIKTLQLKVLGKVPNFRHNLWLAHNQKTWLVLFFFRNTLITLEPVLVTHFDFLRASVKGWRWDFTWELSPGFSTAEGGSLSVVAASPWKPLRAAPPPHWSGPRSRDHGSGMITLTGWIFKGPPRWMRVRAQAQSTESCGAVMLQQWAALHDMRGHWRQGPSDDPKLKIGTSLSIWRLWGPTKTAQKTQPSPLIWVLPKCFGTTHTRWWYSGGAKVYH